MQEKSCLIAKGGKQSRCCRAFSARYVFAAYGFLSLTSIYAMRINLSVAIVAMVNHPEEASEKGESQNDTCVTFLQAKVNHSGPAINNITNFASVFDWDIGTQSAILSAFFHGYTVFQLPGGMVAQHFGGKWTFGIALMASAIFTLITPVAAEWGVAPLIVLRVLLGVIQGLIMPALNMLISQWVPISERSTIFTLVYCGIPFGCAVGMFIGGMLAAMDFLGGWPSIFYVFGIQSFILSILWALFVHETPLLHPRISSAELKVILEEQRDKQNEKGSKVPWLAILTSVPAWSLNFSSFGYGWMLYFFMTELPTYLSNVLRFEMKQNGLLSAAPYVLQAVSSIGASYVADKMLQRKNAFSITTIRKIVNSVASFGSGTCVLIVIFVGCRSSVIVGLICLGMFLNGFGIPGCEVVPVDMTPRYTGILTGIANTFMSMAGSLAPFVAGKLTSSGQTLTNWTYVFAITAAVPMICGCIFNIFGNAEVQPWAPPESEQPSPKEEHKERTWP